MKQLVHEFCTEEFAYVLTRMSVKERLTLEEGVTVVLHCHRYKKRETFLEGRDLSIIRDALYNYSQRVRERFF